MNIMNKVIKSGLTVVLFLAVAVGCPTKVGAADPRTGPQLRPKGTAAKVIMVDAAAKAITVDIQGTIHLYWLSSNVKVRQNGQDATLADIAPGQMVSLTTKKTARGDGEVVEEVTIESSDTETEAAGRARARAVKPKEKEKAKGGGRENDGVGGHGRGIPPLFEPAPVIRPVVSPHN